MAKKRVPSKTAIISEENRSTITQERFARLHLLLTLVTKAPQKRDVLVRKLKLDVRGFYRDLEALRQAGVIVELHEGRYRLSETLDAAQSRLPFPDPRLTVGEARLLATGRSPAHARLRQLLERRLS